MSPAQKKKSKKRKEEKEEQEWSPSKLTFKKKVQLAMWALTALGNGLGQGAIESFLHPHQGTTKSAPVSPTKQDEKLTYPVPQQKDQPVGDEPKQHLKFIYTDNKGAAQTFHTEASVQSLANATLRWAANAPAVQPQSKQEGNDSLTIKAQLHPSAPIVTLNIPKKDIADQIATFGDSSISAENLKSVRHIVISPYLNPPKPSKA